jgi:hypothetical protein
MKLITTKTPRHQERPKDLLLQFFSRIAFGDTRDIKKLGVLVPWW